jgi:hypothetical protein
MKNHRSTGPPGGAQIQAQLQALPVREDEPAAGAPAMHRSLICARSFFVVPD